MTTMLRLVAVACIGIGAASTTARADDDEARAKSAYDAGVTAFTNAKYDAAVNDFEQALALAPTRALIKFSLGQAYRYQYFLDSDVAKAQRALELLREYVAEVATGHFRDDAVKYIAELAPIVARYEADQTAPRIKTELMIVSHTQHAKAHVDKGPDIELPAVAQVTPGPHTVSVEADGFVAQQVAVSAFVGRLIQVDVELVDEPGELKIDTAESGLAVAIDDTPVGATPLTAPVAPGTHVVTVSQRGHRTERREVTLARGERKSIVGSLPRSRRRSAAYIVGASAIAMAGAGVVATGFALSARTSADEISGRAVATLTRQDVSEQNALVDTFHRDAVVSYVMYGCAAAALATTAWLYFEDTPEVDPPRIHVMPAATAAGPALVWTGSF